MRHFKASGAKFSTKKTPCLLVMLARPAGRVGVRRKAAQFQVFRRCTLADRGQIGKSNATENSRHAVAASDPTASVSTTAFDSLGQELANLNGRSSPQVSQAKDPMRASSGFSM